MRSAKHKVLHNPKKVVFSKNKHHTSSFLNLSVNYKRQNESLRENNRELARQLSQMQLRVKASEDKVTELQRALNLQVPKIVSTNLMKMVNLLRPFLEVLDQTIDFCANPEHGVDTTILNPDLTITPLRFETRAHGSLQAKIAPRQVRINGDLFPMTPIEEQNSMDATQSSENDDVGVLRRSVSTRRSSGSKGSGDANVTRRTKSKSRSAASNIELDLTSSPVGTEDADLENTLVQPVSDCFVPLQKLPLSNNVTPGSSKKNKQLITENRNSRDFESQVGDDNFQDLVELEADDCTVKIPVDMDLTVIVHDKDSNFNVMTSQLGSSEVKLVPVDSLEFSKGLKTSAALPVTNKSKKKVKGNRSGKENNSKTKYDDIQTVWERTPAAPVTEKSQVLQKAPDSSGSLKRQRSSKNNSETVEDTKNTMSSPTLRNNSQSQRLSTATEEQNNITKKNLMVTVPANYSEPSVSGVKRMRTTVAVLPSVNTSDSDESTDSDTLKTQNKVQIGKRSSIVSEPSVKRKRQTYVVRSISSSSGDESDRESTKSETTNKKKKAKVKRGFENYRFFSKQTKTKAKPNAGKKSSRLEQKNSDVGKSSGSVFDISFNDSPLAKMKKSATSNQKGKTSPEKNKERLSDSEHEIDDNRNISSSVQNGHDSSDSEEGAKLTRKTRGKTFQNGHDRSDSEEEVKVARKTRGARVNYALLDSTDEEGEGKEWPTRQSPRKSVASPVSMKDMNSESESDSDAEKQSSKKTVLENGVKGRSKHKVVDVSSDSEVESDKSSNSSDTLVADDRDSTSSEVEPETRRSPRKSTALQAHTNSKRRSVRFNNNVAEIDSGALSSKDAETGRAQAADSEVKPVSDSDVESADSDLDTETVHRAVNTKTSETLKEDDDKRKPKTLPVNNARRSVRRTYVKVPSSVNDSADTSNGKEEGNPTKPVQTGESDGALTKSTGGDQELAKEKVSTKKPSARKTFVKGPRRTTTETESKLTNRKQSSKETGSSEKLEKAEEKEDSDIEVRCTPASLVDKNVNLDVKIAEPSSRKPTANKKSTAASSKQVLGEEREKLRQIEDDTPKCAPRTVKGVSSERQKRLPAKTLSVANHNRDSDRAEAKEDEVLPGRSARRAAAVSYKEPSLNMKMRRNF